VSGCSAPSSARRAQSGGGVAARYARERARRQGQRFAVAPEPDQRFVVQERRDGPGRAAASRPAQLLASL
jgi:hypothetical protein